MNTFSSYSAYSVESFVRVSSIALGVTFVSL